MKQKFKTKIILILIIILCFVVYGCSEKVNTLPIAQENTHYCMQIVENKLIIYKYDENWNPSIIVTDFYGNTLNWDV